MKKINTYIFSFVTIFLLFFGFSINVKAEEVEGPSLEEIVINANSNGASTNVYDVVVEKGEEGQPNIVEKKQFTRTRDISININIEQEVLSKYDEIFQVCELIPEGVMNNTREEERCSQYSLNENDYKFQIVSPNDGEKGILVYFYADYATKDVTNKISKNIILDTTGPSIDLIGGEYVYVSKGQKYVEPKATCADESLVKLSDTCIVAIEEKTINSNQEGFQYIRYTATDFLGNETNALRKVMVEVKKESGGIDLYWYFAIGAVGLTTLTVGYIVIKNKDKQKNQSVL